MIIEAYFFFYFSLKPYCDPSSEPSCQDGSDRDHSICFYAELTKSIPNYQQILPLIISLFIAFDLYLQH